MKRTATLIVLAIVAIVSISTAISSSDMGEDDDDRYEDEHDSEMRGSVASAGGWFESRADIDPVDSDTYRDECGACHFAYQPGLLPRRAWEQIMNSLDAHYGDDASLDEESAAAIRAYLLDHAADRASRSRARAFAAGNLSGDALPRITATRYFRREHHEIPTRFVQGNPEVGGFGNCQACHRNAERGIYNEHQVVIPGFGRWDD